MNFLEAMEQISKEPNFYSALIGNFENRQDLDAADQDLQRQGQELYNSVCGFVNKYKAVYGHGPGPNPYALPVGLKDDLLGIVDKIKNILEISDIMNNWPELGKAQIEVAQIMPDIIEELKRCNIFIPSRSPLRDMAMAALRMQELSRCNTDQHSENMYEAICRLLNDEETVSPVPDETVRRSIKPEEFDKKGSTETTRGFTKAYSEMLNVNDRCINM